VEKLKSGSWPYSTEAMERQTFSRDNLEHLGWPLAQNWPLENPISVCAAWAESLGRSPSTGWQRGSW